MSQKRFLPFVAWSLAAWITLAGAIVGLQHDFQAQPLWWCFIPFALMFAVPFGWWALSASRDLAKPWRIIFWMVTLAGCGLCVLLLDGQWAVKDSLPRQYIRALIVVFAIIPVLVAVLLWIRERRAPKVPPGKRGWWLGDAGFGVACLAVLMGAAYFALTGIYVPRVCRVTEEQWAAIGRPMSEFERRFHRVEENASLRDLTRDLEPFGVRSLYKPAFNDPGENPIRTTQEVQKFKGVVDLVSALTDRREDQIPTAIPATAQDSHVAESIAQGTLYLDGKADDFRHLYEGIMHREPPIWGYDPGDGSTMRVPDYFTVRLLTQIITADACLKLQRGDMEGASLAASANLRLLKNMGEQPILASCMIHGALDGYLGKALVRLPAEPDALKNFAAEVQNRREQFKNIIHGEYVWAMRLPDHQLFDARDYIRPAAVPSPLRPVREWLVNLFGRPLYKLRLARDWQFAAKEMKIMDRVSDLTSTDLGIAEINRIESNDPTMLLPSLQYTWWRLNFLLLIREQMELIRMARTQMNAGKSGNLGDYTSVVIPGSKWKMTGDAASHSVSLKLTPIPQWTSDETAGTLEQKLLLPLDGSKSWKFSPPPQKTAAAKP